MFKFSISNLSLFLGKSPVTIRAWERKGLLALPRVGVNRSLTLADIAHTAKIALDAGRISSDRFILINEAIGALRWLEEEE